MKITVCSRVLAFWQFLMPSVLFTKKLSVVVSLHKQTAWLPWRGFCTPRFQYLAQTMAAEAAQGGLPFLLLPVPTPSWSGVRAALTFLGATAQVDPRDGLTTGLAPHLARMEARLCLFIVIWSSEQPGRWSFSGWAISRQSTSLNIVQLSLMHEFFFLQSYQK